jgi:MYXO-CTERM domain-containing protein
VILLLLVRLAAADVVNPEPTNCPPGSVGTSSHAGEWCTPAPTCEEQVCADSCREIGLCVTETEEECGGMQPDTGEPCTFIRTEVHGRCRTQDDCDAGTCIVEERCVDRGPLSCGCASSSAVSAASAFVVLLVLGGTLRMRRYV